MPQFDAPVGEYRLTSKEIGLLLPTQDFQRQDIQSRMPAKKIKLSR